MRVFIVVAAASLAITFADAQTPPAFEVVSIRPSAPVKPGTLTSSGFRVASAGFIGERVTAFDLIAYGFSVPPNRISSVPNWARSDRWDIQAKIPDGEFTNEQVRLMVKALAVDRFQIKVNVEMKETPVYRLVTLPGGARLKPNNPSAPGSRRVARVDGVQEWAEGTQTINSLLLMLTVNTDRPIVNSTGLTGTYVFAFQYVPNELLTAPNSPAGPSVFKALEDQLGLKLEAVKMPLEYLTLERVEKPSEN